MNKKPKVTFGIIVLNGEPFTKYCLRSLYPFAHQIIVVEGGSQHAANWCTKDGHSVDKTLEALQQFKQQEDPEKKVEIVTQNGFWAEKDEQSQAYAKRATGDWLWQVDIDEFYLPSTMHNVFMMLQEDPSITAASFKTITFWGDIKYRVQTLSEVDGFRRLFKFGPGYSYEKHRPPLVRDNLGRDLLTINPLDCNYMAKQNIYLYHYAMLFPHQVLQKCGYYQSLALGRKNAENFDRTTPKQQSDAADWAQHCYLRLEKPFKVHNVTWHPSWLERFTKEHPPQILRMIEEIHAQKFHIDLRQNEDVEYLLNNKIFAIKRQVLQTLAPLYKRTLLAIRQRPWWLRRDLYWRLWEG